MPRWCVSGMLEVHVYEYERSVDAADRLRRTGGCVVVVVAAVAVAEHRIDV